MNKRTKYYLLYLLILFLIYLYNNNTINETYINKYGILNCCNILYINLEHRKDRLTNIKEQISLVNYPEDRTIRIDAIKKEKGALGCAYSHIKALKKILELNNQYTLILEDDFIWKFKPDICNKKINNVFKHTDKWEVCCLACSFGSVHNNTDSDYGTISHCSSASGYIIKQSYVPKLLDLWEKNIVNDKLIKAIDVSWFELQKNDNWITTNPLIGIQIESYSDIELSIKNYGNGILLENK
jgi:glycosyl transferase, family 25